MAVQKQGPFVDPDAQDPCTEQLHLLAESGVRLATARSLDEVAERAVVAGISLTGASAGACFDPSPEGSQSDTALRWSSAPHASFLSDLQQKLPCLFPPASQSAGLLRHDDLQLALSQAPIAGCWPIRSSLAATIADPRGISLGTLVLVHPAAGHFSALHEVLLLSIAAQAGLALDNLSLQHRLEQERATITLARAAQRSTERRLQEALDSAQLGTWDWNSASDLVTLDERAAAIFGVAPGQPLLRAELRQQMVNPEDQQRGLPDLRRILQGGQRYSAEYRICLPDGTVRWVASSGIPALNQTTDRPIGMTGCVKDITESKSQEAALSQSEKLAATGRLAATIAHEINNPLEAVTNLIYLAKTDPLTPAPVEKLLETADAELARVSHIAQQTLVFYRDTTRPANVDLNELLQAVVDLFGRKLATKHLQCILDLDPGLSVIGLQGELRQVVSNLLVNAIDASPSKGGSIRIRGRHRLQDGGGGVSVMISDQGAGIPTHVRSRLFTPFVTTKQAHGTGLGLWVTRGMVERHGGSVRFRSRTEQPTGTVFRIYLPHRTTTELFASPGAAVLQ